MEAKNISWENNCSRNNASKTGFLVLQMNGIKSLSLCAKIEMDHKPYCKKSITFQLLENTGDALHDTGVNNSD